MTAWRKIRAATVTGLLAFVALFGAGSAYAQNLSVAPAELAQEINYNSDAADQKLTLTNPTAASISYTLGIAYGAGATGWLKNPGGGVVAKDNGTKEITVKYQNTKIIDAGVYTATITITETSGGGGPQNVIVTLTVVHPRLPNGLGDFTASCDVRTNPTGEQSFIVSNSGNGELSFSSEIKYLTGGVGEGLVVSP